MSIRSVSVRIIISEPCLKLPVSSIFNLFFVYLFLPIPRKAFITCVGILISTITIVTSVISNNIITIIYQDIESKGPGYTQQLMADITFHLCVNLTGWYLRYVCDINMRRGFLDKRGCIETTFRLKYEKEQEVRM